MINYRNQRKNIFYVERVENTRDSIKELIC